MPGWASPTSSDAITFRPLRNELDHVFVDQVTAEHVVSWRVDPEPATTLGLSDHAPLLIDLTRPPVRLRRTGISP